MVRGLLGGISTQALRVALDGLSRRQRVIADNVANVDTPGYRSAAVTFESQLQRALETERKGARARPSLATTDPRHLTGRESDLGSIRPQTVLTNDQPMRNDGNNVDVEREMAALAETQIAYDAMSQLMSKKIAGLKRAITEGRQ